MKYATPSYHGKHATFHDSDSCVQSKVFNSQRIRQIIIDEFRAVISKTEIFHPLPGVPGVPQGEKGIFFTDFRSLILSWRRKIPNLVTGRLKQALNSPGFLGFLPRIH